ncbi:MAG: class I SAM-dependent methyltransferase [Planctomycetota bacterium]|nr:class I SAM-dependent methyltransferase [Planctomycetota bacterium]
MKMCEFLKSRREVDVCSRLLDQQGLIHHIVNPKDWDLAHIVPALSDGNLLDMGSSDSYLLWNAVTRGIKGFKIGIDFRPPERHLRGVSFMVGDLMTTQLPANSFQNLTCLSVLEHGVDYKALATEAARLLAPGGRIYLSFDYWEPKIIQDIPLYGLTWNILCKPDAVLLINIFQQHGLQLAEEVDWTLGDAVIQADYWAPPGSRPYTFGLLTFTKIT